MIVRKYIAELAPSEANVGARQVLVIASDPAPDRDGDILMPSGCILDNYRKNPIVLANHDKSQAIGTADVAIRNNRVEALITFAPEGISDLADRYCALVKAGIINAISVGFITLEAEPIRATRGQRINKWELLEISFVTVPANASALIIQRAAKAGRVLSAANEGKLRQAHDAAAAVRAAIAEVLEGAGADPMDNDGDEGKRLSRCGRQFEFERAQLSTGSIATRSARRAAMRRFQMEASRHD